MVDNNTMTIALLRQLRCVLCDPLLLLILGLATAPQRVLAQGQVEDAVIRKYQAMNQFFQEKIRDPKMSAEKETALRKQILRPADEKYQKALNTWEEQLLQKFNLKRPGKSSASKSPAVESGSSKNDVPARKLGALIPPEIKKEPKPEEKKPPSEGLVLDGSGIPDYLEFKKAQAAKEPEKKGFEILQSTDDAAFGAGESHDVVEFQK